ncbi:MAG: B12-binding domain-containing radical SAM protein [Chitinophagales bacterium]|nr:B12-binding domain-containing radical SAM protein [Chitinophagales bacterium]MDW8417781.1 radical SAM protein [Chitinophagales bacterium]
MRPLKVTFVGLGTEQLGISQLSAIARREGHKVGLAFSASLFHDRFNLEFPAIAPFFDDTHDVIQAIKDQQPDVLAFGALTSTYQWMLQVAQTAKEINPRIKTVFGGVHPSAVPHLVIARPQVDFVVVGEGDEAFPAILKTIANDDYSRPIFNTSFKNKEGQVISGMQKGFLQHLDTLPFYDKELWEDYVRLGDLYLTMASRGCPYRCTFCFNNFFAKLPEEKSGKYVRLRSVDHVIAELKIAKRRYKIYKVDFQDDVFATSKKWLEEFAWKYKKEINIPYNILTHPRYMDEDTARWLKESGCEWIQMGVQSMDESFKKESLLRYERSEDVENALNLMRKYGLLAKVDHMFGLPNEPMEAQENARVLYAKTHPKRVQTFWTCYLPGTQLMREAEERGDLTPEQVRKINEGEEFYFFRNTENVKDKHKMHQYKLYEVIFRLMPALPDSWKIHLTLQKASLIPAFLVRPLSMMADIITGFKQRNPEFIAYALHNLYHLKRFFLKKIGLKAAPASRVIEDVSFAQPYQPVIEQKPAETIRA